SVINESLAGLKQIKSSLGVRAFSPRARPTHFNSGIPDHWVYARDTADYLFETGSPFSYAWFISVLQEIEKNHDAEKYEAFKAFVEYKEARPELQAGFEQRLRDFEKGLVFSLAKTEVQNLAFVQRLRRMTTQTGFFIEKTQTLKALFSLPLAYGVFWAQNVFDASRQARSLMSRVQEDYRPDAFELRRLAQFLRTNVTKNGMPLSFQVPRDYWKLYKPSMNRVDAVLERLIVEHSLSIYDGATWQIALALMRDPADWHRIDAHTDRLLSGSSGGLKEIKAFTLPFSYGDRQTKLTRDNAYFFRIIADTYFQDDPGSTKNEMVEFPNFAEFHHEDWKPITGEQAWAAMIGPLQWAYIKYSGNIPMDCKEMRLALEMLPAFEAMLSPAGALYHAPHGTHQKRPTDISNENNYSVYAALKMLRQIAGDRDPALAKRAGRLMEAQEDYFRRLAFDREREIFYQGGFYENGRFIPSEIYAVDCQTWALITLGQPWIDRNFGEGAAYRIWQNVKKHSGYFDNDGVLRGVGFTDGHKVLSGEWTCGAILATKLLARSYMDTRPSLSKELEDDTISMRVGIESLKQNLSESQTSYFYANRRHFMPFGWWANPIPSMISSTWVIMTDKGYDPFILGGGPDYDPAVEVKSLNVWPRTAGDLSRWARKIPTYSEPMKETPVFAPAPRPVPTALIEAVRAPSRPVLLNMSLNPLLQRGIEELGKAAAGADPEKIREFSVSLRAIGLLTLLVLLAGFLYMVYRKRRA
ncbi:MAG: hypothetical protein WCG06_03930, partial [Candidatus Omnitrophota bacterium]